MHLQIDGLGFPGHFMARYQDRHGCWLLDPFYATVIAPDEVAAHLEMALGKPMALPPTPWTPVTPAQLALRILHNLRNAFMARKDLALVTRMLDGLIAIEPDAGQYWRERALLHYGQQQWEETQHDLRHYFVSAGLTPQFILPGLVRNQPAVVGKIATGDQPLLELYRESSLMLSKIN